VGTRATATLRLLNRAHTQVEAAPLTDWRHSVFPTAGPTGTPLLELDREGWSYSSTAVTDRGLGGRDRYRTSRLCRVNCATDYLSRIRSREGE
jgi:hypothetical protein